MERGGRRDRLCYTHDIHDPARRREYNGLPEDRIAIAYGLSDRKTLCGSATVWTYDDPGKLNRDLARASPLMKSLFAAASLA